MLLQLFFIQAIIRYTIKRSGQVISTIEHFSILGSFKRNTNIKHIRFYYIIKVFQIRQLKKKPPKELNTFNLLEAYIEKQYLWL